MFRLQVVGTLALADAEIDVSRESPLLAQGPAMSPQPVSPSAEAPWLPPAAPRSTRFGGTACAAAAYLLFSACGGTEGDAPAAGVGVPRWSLEAEPLMTVGVADGDPAYMFEQVTSALPLPSGRVLVVDGGQRVLRVFAADGSFEREMGGPGQGPGELESIGGVWLVAPDTVRVFDRGNGRFTSYLVDGSFAGTHRVVTGPGGPQRIPELLTGVFADGAVGLAWISAATRRAGEVHPDQMQVGRFARDGVFEGIVAEGTGLRRFVGASGSGPLPFSPFPYIVTAGDLTCFTDGSLPEIGVHDRQGVRVGTLALPSASSTPADVAAAWRDLEDELRRQDDTMWLDRLPEMPRTESIPHVAGLLADDGGFIRVRAYEPLRDALPLASRRGGGGSWWVLDPDGNLAATLTLPDAAEPLTVVGDLVFARHRGELDVPALAVYRLVRKGG